MPIRQIIAREAAVRVMAAEPRQKPKPTPADMSPGEQVLFRYLVELADTNRVLPTVDQIAEALGWSQTTTATLLLALEHRQHITSERMHGCNWRKAVTIIATGQVIRRAP